MVLQLLLLLIYTKVDSAYFPKICTTQIKFNTIRCNSCRNINATKNCEESNISESPSKFMYTLKPMTFLFVSTSSIKHCAIRSNTGWGLPITKIVEKTTEHYVHVCDMQQNVTVTINLYKCSNKYKIASVAYRTIQPALLKCVFSLRLKITRYELISLIP